MKNIFSILTAIALILFSATLIQAETSFQVYFQDQNKYKDVIVTAVLSTDLIQLESGEKVRLIGLNAPDNLKKRQKRFYDEDGNPIEEEEDAEALVITPIEEEAIKYVSSLLMKKHVRLEFDDLKKSDDYSTFAYVYLLPDNIFANAEILKLGYANLQIIPPNMKKADELRAAYREARTERRGLQNQ
jgi:micrococcal nuclease